MLKLIGNFWELVLLLFFHQRLPTGIGLYLADVFWGGMLHARSSSLSYRRGLSKKYPLEERTWFGMPAMLCGHSVSQPP